MNRPFFFQPSDVVSPGSELCFLNIRSQIYSLPLPHNWYAYSTVPVYIIIDIEVLTVSLFEMDYL